MNKVLVTIYCAATIKKYDIWLPKKMKIGAAVGEITDAIRSYEDNENLFSDERELILYLTARQVVLNREYTVEQCGIMSGQTLILV